MVKTLHLNTLSLLFFLHPSATTSTLLCHLFIPLPRPAPPSLSHTALILPLLLPFSHCSHLHETATMLTSTLFTSFPIHDTLSYIFIISNCHSFCLLHGLHILHPIALSSTYMSFPSSHRLVMVLCLLY